MKNGPLLKILFFPISLLLFILLGIIVVTGYTGDWLYALRRRAVKRSLR